MRRIILLAAGLALVATACGSPIEKGNLADETKAPTTSPTATATATQKPCPANAVTLTKDTEKDLTKKPRLVIKSAGCSPPASLIKTDLVVGTGAEVKPGDTVTAHYLGVSWSTRKQFDASWDRGEPTEFPLSGVIKGWTDGLPGMKVGGRRLLIIPPDQGYGPSGQGADIGPNETLIFVVDMKATKSS